MFKGMYFNGKLIKSCGRRGQYYDDRMRADVLVVELYLGGENQPFLWVSNKYDRPTDVVPRAYHNHVNQRILEDISDG